MTEPAQDDARPTTPPVDGETAAPRRPVSTGGTAKKTTATPKRAPAKRTASPASGAANGTAKATGRRAAAPRTAPPARTRAAAPVVFQEPAVSVVPTEPVASEPVVLDEVVAAPVAPEPVPAEPVVTEPVVTEPVVTESVVTESVAPEPVVPVPVASDVAAAARPSFTMVSSGVGQVRTLPTSPSGRSLMVKAALPFRSGSGMPTEVLRLEQVVASVDRVAAYAHTTGGHLGAALPPLFPHMLGFPLQMSLMGERRFPFPAIGLVHVTNDAVQLTSIPVGAPVDVEVHVEGPRAHRRGVTLDMVTRVMLDGEVAWYSTSTYLRRGSSSAGGATPSPSEGDALVAETERDEPAPLPQRSVWRLEGDLGRRYAAVSGDANPIHTSALGAKAFGFPRAIAHGMWTAARCASAYEGRLGETWRMNVQFRAPILLPSTVTLHESPVGEESAFEVRGKRDRLHLSGTFHS